MLLFLQTSCQSSVEIMSGIKHDCNYLAHALSIVVVGASGDLAKKKVRAVEILEQRRCNRSSMLD